jgi:23S rRNA pseudouridine1911/1915/1917 synthase
MDLEVSERDAGERVDVFVTTRIGSSRSDVQAALKAGTVTVNGLPAKPSLRLEPGDKVSGEVADRTPGPPQAENIPLELRHSDERVVVVSKPAGLVTHPAGGHASGTLINALLGLGIPLAQEGTARPGIVHRLDKDTSGLLLVARDDAAHSFLVDAMKNRRIERRYLALVRGVPATLTGTVEAPIGRHRSRRKMAVLPEGRRAVTHYEVLASAGGVSLLDVRLETGRTHQIRVHLAFVKHPVMGDGTYGGRSERSAELGLTRPFLHAFKLRFPHPDGGEVEVADPLPEDLRAVLERAGVEPPGT